MRFPERLIDANLNRAGEALRVLEDLARFVLDDPELGPRLKAARHELVSVCEDLAPRSIRLLERDVAGDVGRETKVEAEAGRTTLAQVAAAAGARLTQALRVLEEAAKLSTDHPGHWRRIEAIRYAAYDIDRAIGLRLRAGGGGGRPQWRLCVLVTESLCTRPWLEVAEGALAGGADCLQLREKGLADRNLLARAREMVSVAHAHGAHAIINDRPDIAVLAGADGVHVGQGDLGVDDARRIVGDDRSVGVSTANLDQARRAIALGADVCGLGPMFPSPTKPKDHLAGPAYLARYLEAFGPETSAPVPHLAISGIDADRAAELAGLGCQGVAVSGAVCSAPDPEGAARGIREALAPGAGLAAGA